MGANPGKTCRFGVNFDFYSRLNGKPLKYLKQGNDNQVPILCFVLFCFATVWL